MTARGDEFYVGYADRGPAAIARRVRTAIVTALAIGLALAMLLAISQASFDAGEFEFGVDRVFEGMLVEHPYPLLIAAGGEGGESVTHLLVGFGKHGASGIVGGWGGRRVRVTGSLIANEQMRMIEVHDLEPLEDETAVERPPGAGDALRLGRATLVGEIVDSKCHLGVMKPGRGKAHRACAILCIRGGVPPVLRVEDRSGRVEYFLLEDPTGRPVNDRVLELVAVPVEITGDLVRRGDRLVLVADPTSYRELAGRSEGPRG